MKCDDIQQLIQKKLDGTIDTLEATILEAHLQTCEHCRLAQEQYERLHIMLKNLPEVHLDEAPLDTLWPEIQTVYRQQMNRARQKAKRRTWLRRGVLGALSAVAILAVVLWGEGWLAFITSPQSATPAASLRSSSEKGTDSQVTASLDNAYNAFPQNDLKKHEPVSAPDALETSTIRNEEEREEREVGISSSTGNTHPSDMNRAIEKKNADDPASSTSVNKNDASKSSVTEEQPSFQKYGRYALTLNEKSVQLFLMDVDPSSVSVESNRAIETEDQRFFITSHEPNASPNMSVSSVNEPSVSTPHDTEPSSPAYTGLERVWEERFPEKSTDHQLMWLDDQTFQVTYRLDGSTWIQVFTIDPAHHKVQKKSEKRH